MKHLYLIICVLLGTSALAQNYECFKPNEIQYFTNIGGYLRGMRIDSVKLTVSGTVYYPFRTPRGDYLSMGGELADTNGGSWLGKAVVERNDGVWEFGNTRDTVFIETQAALGTSWVFYNDTFSRYYMAEVTGVDTISVLGVLDSAKTITITAMTSAGVNANDLANGLQLLLTKNHGFYQAIDLYTFPYIMPNKTTHEMDFYTDVMYSTCDGIIDTQSLFQFVRSDFIHPLNKDIYDYQVGDIMQGQSKLFAVQGFYTDTIVSKITTSSGSIYTIHRSSKAQLPVPTVLESDTTTLTVGGKLSSYSLLMPEELHNKEAMLYHSADTSWGVVSPSYDIRPLAAEFYMFWVPNGWKDVYKEKRGRIDFWGYEQMFQYIYHKLLYYNTSGKSYGTYTPLGISENVQPNTRATLYPNPATDKLHIKVDKPDEQNCTLQITDVLGRILQTYTAFQPEVDVSALSVGEYYLSLYFADKQPVIRKFSIVR